MTNVFHYGGAGYNSWGVQHRLSSQSYIRVLQQRSPSAADPEVPFWSTISSGSCHPPLNKCCRFGPDRPRITLVCLKGRAVSGTATTGSYTIIARFLTIPLLFDLQMATLAAFWDRLYYDGNPWIQRPDGNTLERVKYSRIPPCSLRSLCIRRLGPQEF